MSRQVAKDEITVETTEDVGEKEKTPPPRRRSNSLRRLFSRSSEREQRKSGSSRRERHDSETSSTGRDDLDVSMSRDRIKPALVSRKDTREARETRDARESRRQDQLDVDEDHEMGEAFMDMFAIVTDLSASAGRTEMPVSASELKAKMLAGIRSIVNDTARRTERIVDAKYAQLKREIEERDQKAYTIEQEIEPPIPFPEGSNLHHSSVRADMYRLFPKQGGKFSGQPGGKDAPATMEVVEYLRAINKAQATCQLCEEDFRDAMLGSTTGKAHALISQWMDANETTTSIYHMLVLQFDRRATPEESKQQLNIFKATKNMNLAKLITVIGQLAARSSAIFPAGDSRKAVMDMDSSQALIRCLPTASSNQAANVYAQTSARLGRVCNYGEFHKSLSVYRTTIDADIRANGVDLPRNKNRNTHSNGKNKGNGNGNNGASNNLSVNAVQQGQSKGNDNKQNKGGNKKAGRPWDGCNMCGKRGHKAADGCPHMWNDRGEVVKCNPTQATCDVCPKYIKHRLNHPQSLCPFRKGGPLHSGK